MHEALRYLANARGLLRHAPHEGNIYTDLKPVREAFGTAYLAVLKAVDSHLIARGVPRDGLPKSYEGYQAMLRRYTRAHNGRFPRHLDRLYDLLHIAGYYRGLIGTVDAARVALGSAEDFIRRLSPS